MTRLAILLAVLVVGCTPMHIDECARACGGRVERFSAYENFVGHCSCYQPVDSPADAGHVPTAAETTEALDHAIARVDESIRIVDRMTARIDELNEKVGSMVGDGGTR